MSGFLFATGIENSYPVIAGNKRIDQMEACGHYEQWRDDLQLASEMGLNALRWGPALYKVFAGPGRYDWSWTDEVLSELNRLDIEPILDLCHFGVPDWLGNFQNREFPEYFAEYAAAFARRHPHVHLWTPINEPFITCHFSARNGWWNERLTSESSFLRAVINVGRASVLAMDAIRHEIPSATFVQSESIEYFHAADPSAASLAKHLNERKYLPLDLITATPLSQLMRGHLLAHGISTDEIQFFSDRRQRHRFILGTDYYATNEHVVRANGASSPAGDALGYYALAMRYYDRYRCPLMSTETNRREELGASEWLLKQWHAAMRLRAEGVPMLGFTWFSLTDQIDWDIALREQRGVVNSVGLFDLNRNIRPAGELYRQLVSGWASELGGQNASRQVRAA